MKIVMFAAAVAATAALWADGLESANTVGYQSDAMGTAGVLEMTGVMFKEIGTNVIDIQKLKLNDGTPADATSSIMYWVPGGTAWSRAYWCELYNDAEMEDPILDENDNPVLGWGSDLWQILPVSNERKFKLGAGFFLDTSTDAEAPALTVSGEVKSEPTAQLIGVPITAGVLEIVSNPMPGDGLEVQEIEMSEGVPADATTSIMYWTPGGTAWSRAYWCELYNDTEMEDPILDENDNPVLGWGSDLWQKLQFDVNFKAGEAYFVDSSTDAIEPEVLYTNPLYRPAN